MPTTRRASRKRSATQSDQPWASQTELVGVRLKLQAQQDSSLYAQYPIGLHAWFLDQVRQVNPDLSAYLHDGESEKPFTISGLEGVETGHGARLRANQICEWTVTSLEPSLAAWMADWVQQLPAILELRSAPLDILGWEIAHPATTYEKLFSSSSEKPFQFALSFISPTSFRRKGHHFPLPVPMNVFHSYLRRWNDFSGETIDSEDFLAWVDEFVIISRHELRSIKVAAGKKGSVTGFTGAVEFSLAGKAQADADYGQLLLALSQFAPYCGTGHKTTFGLGQTRLGWLDAEATTGTAMGTATPATLEAILAQRIFELTEYFMTQRKRTGGDRAQQISETWATILARRELGESLQVIAADLEMSYETVKTYAKLARRSIIGGG